MNKTVYYLFDPLCGWCYGAAPALARLAADPGIAIELLPTGMFSGHGARLMTDDFARFAWSNDERIGLLTGQPFTAAYRQSVLADHQQRFDSGPASLALTAVALHHPSNALAALGAIQHARFVEGRNVTDLAVLAAILETTGMREAGAALASPGAALLEAHREGVAEARSMMHHFQAQGVPTLIGALLGRRWLLQTSSIYADPGALAAQMQAA